MGKSVKKTQNIVMIADLEKEIASLKQQLEELKDIVAIMPGHVYLKDNNGVFKVCNDLQAKDFGYNQGYLVASDLIGKTDYDILPKNQASQVRAIDLEVMRSKKTQVIEEIVTLPNGEQATFLSQKVPFYGAGSKNPTGILGISFNITEYKRNEEKLRKTKIAYQKQEQKHKEKLISLNKQITGLDIAVDQTIEDYITNIKDYFENLIAVMPGNVYWMNKDNVFLGCNNNQAANANLKSRQDIIGKTNYDMPWKEQADALNVLNNKVMRENKAYVAEEFATMINDSGVFLSHKVPLHDRTGEVIGLLGISFNISERKKLEEDLKKAKENAEQLDMLKSNFIQNMEHDIRTPFSGIYGLTSLLVEQETDKTKKSLLTDVHNSAKELLDYCNTILDFANIESETIPIISKRFNLKNLISKVIIMELPAAKTKNLSLKMQYQDDIPSIFFGDSFRIKRMLINLISNAIKFTNQGYVEISVKLAKPLDKKGRKAILAISVKDSGIGIPKSVQDFLFEKFIKGSPSNKGIHKGHGLGLRIVRQFISELDGNIDVISKEKQGTEIICTIPFEIPLVDVLP